MYCFDRWFIRFFRIIMTKKKNYLNQVILNIFLSEVISTLKPTFSTKKNTAVVKSTREVWNGESWSDIINPVINLDFWKCIFMVVIYLCNKKYFLNCKRAITNGLILSVKIKHPKLYSLRFRNSSLFSWVMILTFYCFLRCFAEYTWN